MAGPRAVTWGTMPAWQSWANNMVSYFFFMEILAQGGPYTMLVGWILPVWGAWGGSRAQGPQFGGRISKMNSRDTETLVSSPLGSWIQLTRTSGEAENSSANPRIAYFAKTSHRAPKTSARRPEGDRGVPQPYKARETSFGKVVIQPSVVFNPSHNQIQNKNKIVTEKVGIAKKNITDKVLSVMSSD